MTRGSFEVRPFPRGREEIVDALEVGVGRHMVHALLDLDVTDAWQRVRDHEASPGERLSFTAFLVASLARAIDGNRCLHACRDWRGRLVLFDEVDVVTLIESEVDAVAVPHVIRAANRRTVGEIHAEIRRIQAEPAVAQEHRGHDARHLGRDVRTRRGLGHRHPSTPHALSHGRQRDGEAGRRGRPRGAAHLPGGHGERGPRHRRRRSRCALRAASAGDRGGRRGAATGSSRSRTAGCGVDVGRQRWFTQSASPCDPMNAIPHQ